MSLRTFVLSLCVALSPGLAHAAPNLVPNGTFDGSIAGWAPNEWLAASLSSSAVDQHGKTGGGSLRLYALEAADWQGGIDSDCFPVHPGQPIVFGASAWAAEIDDNHTVSAVISFYSDGACALGTAGAAWADLSALEGASTWRPIQGHTETSEWAHSARVTISVSNHGDAPAEILVDNVFAYEGARCRATSQVACLTGDRFRLDVQWRVDAETTGWAGLRGVTEDSAFATFFTPDNVELVVKVLDGCATNDRFWVFATGLTNVKVTSRVVDTITGEAWIHHSPLNKAFAPVQDTLALPVCPK